MKEGKYKETNKPTLHHMAPAVEYEIHACLDTYTEHERKQHDYCATEYQSKSCRIFLPLECMALAVNNKTDDIQNLYTLLLTQHNVKTAVHPKLPYIHADRQTDTHRTNALSPPFTSLFVHLAEITKSGTRHFV